MGFKDIVPWTFELNDNWEPDVATTLRRKGLIDPDLITSDPPHDYELIVRYQGQEVFAIRTKQDPDKGFVNWAMIDGIHDKHPLEVLMDDANRPMASSPPQVSKLTSLPLPRVGTRFNYTQEDGATYEMEIQAVDPSTGGMVVKMLSITKEI